MKIKHLISAVLALLLACSLPVTALAAEYDLAEGSVTVIATESGQTVTHGSNAAVPDDAPVIVQSNSETPTTNTVTVKAEENATANVTIQGVNIVISDPSDAPPVDGSGKAAVTIDAAENAAANVTLDGVNIDTGGTGDDVAANIPGEAAVQITGSGDVTLELDGENTVQGGMHRAGVEKNDADSSGNLTITDENGKDGSLNATGGSTGAGIGGGANGSGSDITISGGSVTATGGSTGAGIGGGAFGSGRDITVTSNAKVTAQGGWKGAGIGGGFNGSGSNITIQGSAEVTATGDTGGAGIGGGRNNSGSSITVSEDAQVKAQGGESFVNPYAPYASGAGAAIGNGGVYQHGTTDAEPLKGREETPNTDALNEGWIAAYAPGTENMDTAVPNSLTYKDDNGYLTTSSNAVPFTKQKPTCTEDGYRAGFTVGNTQVGGETLPATGHNVPNGYTPQNDATCTTLGTMKGYCTNCQTTVTIPDPNSEYAPHSFTNYISNPDATYDHDGTKTARCDFCDATDTIPDPGSKLVWATAPLYRVVDQDGKALACKAERKDGVLTITAEADFAALTGTLGGIRTLKTQGIDTIVFVTNGATSTFALSDLLAQDGDGYTLTHDGAAVTFTMTDGADVSKILQ